MGPTSVVLSLVLHAAALATARATHAPPPVAAARQALAAHELERARQLAADAALIAPDDPAGWLALGLALFRADRAADAEPAFRRATELAPANALAWFNLGSARYQSGRFAAAETAYARAAALDGKLAGLAWYDAALAARDDGRRLDAAQHFDDAARAARAAGSSALVERATRGRDALLHEHEHELAKRGKAALSAHRFADAAHEYDDALRAARARGAAADELAELEYARGQSLLAAGAVEAARQSFAAATHDAPAEPDFALMLGVTEWKLGHAEPARLALERALTLGARGDERADALAYLAALKREREHASDRLTLDLRVGIGYDSDVPESTVLPTAGTATIPEADAGEITVDFDLLWRFFGSPMNHLALDYRFGQLAYLSSALDQYSLQEHDLGLLGRWTPHDKLSLEAGVDGFVVFAGIETFTPFQIGLTPVGRMFVREGYGLETRLRYDHIFKWSLDTEYNYLAGDRDEAAVTEEWRSHHLRLGAGYQFSSERIGVQTLSLAQITFPFEPPYPASTPLRYSIAYSYQGHEARLLAVVDAWRDFRFSVDARYEKRFYTRPSVVRDAQTMQLVYRTDREDDRYTIDGIARYYLPKGFDVEVAYTLVVNRSNIDFFNPATPLDYDNKNYLKHVIEVAAAFRY